MNPTTCHVDVAVASSTNELSVLLLNEPSSRLAVTLASLSLVFIGLNKMVLGKKRRLRVIFAYVDPCSGFAPYKLACHVRRVPRFNKLLVGRGAPFRFLAIISGQFDYILSIFCVILCVLYLALSDSETTPTCLTLASAKY